MEPKRPQDFYYTIFLIHTFILHHAFIYQVCIVDTCNKNSSDMIILDARQCMSPACKYYPVRAAGNNQRPVMTMRNQLVVVKILLRKSTRKTNCDNTEM